MCGRYTLEATWAAAQSAAAPHVFAHPANDPVPAYNIAPTQHGWVVAGGHGGHEAVQMRWGLLPPWAKDAKLAYSTINARLETVASKPAFRAAWKSRRCLVPASGYYEWPVIDGVKRTHFIRRTDSHVLWFGGIWERRDEGAGGVLQTYAIVTKAADRSIATLHDRMPLILAPALLADWINADAAGAMALAMSVPEPPLAYYEVDKAVGNVRNQGATLSAEISKLPPNTP